MRPRDHIFCSGSIPVRGSFFIFSRDIKTKGNAAKFSKTGFLRSFNGRGWNIYLCSLKDGGKPPTRATCASSRPVSNITSFLTFSNVMNDGDASADAMHITAWMMTIPTPVWLQRAIDSIDPKGSHRDRTNDPWSSWTNRKSIETDLIWSRSKNRFFCFISFVSLL